MKDVIAWELMRAKILILKERGIKKVSVLDFQEFPKIPGNQAERLLEKHFKGETRNE